MKILEYVSHKRVLNFDLFALRKGIAYRNISRPMNKLRAFSDVNRCINSTLNNYGSFSTGLCENWAKTQLEEFRKLDL